MNSATTQNLRDQAEDAAGRTAHRINEAANTTSAAVRDATHKVGAAVGEMGDRASAAGQGLSRRVEEQPLTAVLIAATAGFAVGMLLGRR